MIRLVSIQPMVLYLNRIIADINFWRTEQSEMYEMAHRYHRVPFVMWSILIECIIFGVPHQIIVVKMIPSITQLEQYCFQFPFHFISTFVRFCLLLCFLCILKGSNINTVNVRFFEWHREYQLLLFSLYFVAFLSLPFFAKELRQNVNRIIGAEINGKRCSVTAWIDNMTICAPYTRRESLRRLYFVVDQLTNYNTS